jgi:hypothetical protein
MSGITNSQVLVIGLGGCGGLAVNSIQESNVDNITCIHLDVTSPIFENFFHGYMVDVENTIINRIHLRGNDFSTVLGGVGNYGPLRELPDGFMQNTSRPLMRASLHLFWEKLIDLLNVVSNSPRKVHIICSTSGRTGSGWIMDIASMVRSIHPNTPIEISLVMDFPNYREARTTSSKCRTYWTLREFQSFSDPSAKITIEPTIEQAILSIISRTEEHQNQRSAINTDDLITAIAKDISIDFHQRDSYFHRFFWRERSRQISDLITDQTKNLIAGYALANAEGRSNGFRDGRILEFNSRNRLEKYRITFMLDSVSGSSYSSLKIGKGYGLSIIPYEKWHETQEKSFQILCEEGLYARTGQLSHLGIEAKSTLISLKSDFQNSIDELSKTTHFDAKIYAETLPIYVEIIDEILSSNS